MPLLDELDEVQQDTVLVSHPTDPDCAPLRIDIPHVRWDSLKPPVCPDCGAEMRISGSSSPYALALNIEEWDYTLLRCRVNPNAHRYEVNAKAHLKQEVERTIRHGDTAHDARGTINTRILSWARETGITHFPHSLWEQVFVNINADRYTSFTLVPGGDDLWPITETFFEDHGLPFMPESVKERVAQTFRFGIQEKAGAIPLRAARVYLSTAARLMPLAFPDSLLIVSQEPGQRLPIINGSTRDSEYVFYPADSARANSHSIALEIAARWPIVYSRAFTNSPIVLQSHEIEEIDAWAQLVEMTRPIDH